jgi:hypothetical protein
MISRSDDRHQEVSVGVGVNATLLATRLSLRKTGLEVIPDLGQVHAATNSSQ